MIKKFLSGFLVFLTIIIVMQEVEAAENSFAKRTEGMAEIKDLRYSVGSGRIRIVLDITKTISYDLKYMESPSRMIIDINNSWVSDKIPKEIALKSTAASKLRIAQFNSSQVRVVIETSAENNVFILDGGAAGKRLVIDIGADAEKPGFEKQIGETINPTESTIETKIESEPQPETDISKVPEGVPKLNSEDKKEDKSKKDKKEKKEKKEKKDKKENKDSENKKDDKDDDKDKDINKQIEDLTNLKGKKIVIDPGHGGNDSGAIGPSGVMEKTVTLRVALELETLLENEGATVIMTRRTDIEVAPRGRQATDIEELKERCEIANRAKADIFISIHMDSFTNPAARGTTGYYFSQGSPNSKKLADCIRKALCEELKTPSRGTQPCNFYVVRNTDMPATLIELAFISNAIEEKLMNSKEGVQQAAQGILDGIQDYFG